MLLKTEGSTIGIELRAFLHDEGSDGSPSKRKETLRAKVVAGAEQIYKESGFPPVTVSVHWNDHAPFEYSGVPRLAQVLAGLVGRHIPEPSGARRLDYPDPAWREVPPEIHYLWIDRYDPSAGNFWASEEGGAVPEVGISDIERAIRDKEPRLAAYREAADELWLLIVASGFNLSGFCEIGPELDRHVFETGFDRVFFLHYAYCRVLELKTQERRL